MTLAPPIIDYLTLRGLTASTTAASFAEDYEQAADIARRLAEQFTHWETALHGLRSLGERLNGCATWPEAALRIRHVAPHDLCTAMIHGIEADEPSLPRLWQAIAHEGYREVGIDAPGFAALLAERDHVSLPRYEWLLHEIEIAAVFNLVRAQQRLLHAAEMLLRCWPDIMAAALRRDEVGAAYWAMVLLYTARRWRTGLREPTTEEHRPPRPLPTEDRWLQAWRHAVIMDPFCISATSLSRNDLFCPRCWD